MNKKIFAKPLIITGVILFSISVYMVYITGASIKNRNQAIQTIDTHLTTYVSNPFENSALSQEAPLTEIQNEALYSYQATDTLMFLSHSEQWDEVKLQELYNELLQNKHGEEMTTLHEVVVWPQADENALATHSSDVLAQSLKVNFGALPEDFQLDFMRSISLIALYDGDEKNTIESMASALSHEYGHLYTFYYMFDAANLDLADTEYSQLREYDKYDLITTAFPALDYWENHHRYLFEVAANDYVQLMGSPTARQTTAIQDVRQLINSGANPSPEGQYIGNGLIPQENLKIPLASEVDGLSKYFHQFIGEEAPVPTSPRNEITITIEPGSQGYDLIDGYRNFVYYDLKWNTPYQDATYILVCYDAGDYLIQPIKTVLAGQESVATIGTVTRNKGDHITYMSDEHDQGTKIFLVLALLPDGTYYSSEALEYTFPQ